MKYCKSCKVASLDVVGRCPLCEAILVDLPDSKGFEDLSAQLALMDEDRYPDVVISKSSYSFVKRIYAFLAVLIIGASIAMDILIDSDVTWSIISIAAVLYGWTLIYHAIRTNVHIGSKIFVQAISASVFIVLVDQFTVFEGWSVNYVVPQILTLSNVAIFILMMINRMVWREFVFYQLAMTVIGFVPIALIVFDVVTRPLASIVCIVISAVILVGTVIFGDKTVKSELIRRFHV
ncbi:MAG TPA: hypothetical protein DCS67_12085 [Clostridiales bacterium UBA8960]|nr:hypothetical protein [Clostridiales bacterium UBA8960]